MQDRITKATDDALIIDFKSENGNRYLGGPHYVDFVLQSELCLPAPKIEAIMLQCLIGKAAKTKSRPGTVE